MGVSVQGVRYSMIPCQRFCDVENIGDFSRYYQGAWVGYHVSDSIFIQPCYVGGMVDGNHVQLRPLTNTEGKFTIANGFNINWENLKSRTDFGVPDIGMLPEGPTASFCSYATPRAAKKGFRSRDVRVADFNTWEIRRRYVSRSPGNERYDWTWFVFNPEYVTLEQAEDKLNKGEAVGIPISRTLAVYSLPKFKNSLLAYKRWTVGHIVNPFLIHLKREYADYEHDIARQTGAEVIVG